MIRTNGGRLGALALLAALAVYPSMATAGSFQVNPVRLDLSAKATTAALSVKNTGDEAVVVQVNVEAWSQQDGKDVYAPTKDVLVTPPVLNIPAGAERVVRVGLRRAADRSKELSYRLFLQEVPPPPKPGFQGLVVALRVGLPLFVAPLQAAAAPRITWQALRGPDNKVELQALNEGTGHLQVSELALLDPADAAVASYAGLTYILPEQRRSWTLPLIAPLDASRVRVKAVTDAGNLTAEINLPK